MKATYFASILALTVSAGAFAHDSALHEKSASATKPKPTTCEQVADTKQYNVDLKDPAVKALKERCDKEKKSGG